LLLLTVTKVSAKGEKVGGWNWTNNRGRAPIEEIFTHSIGKEK